jgi:hypothetical protein
MIWIVLTFRDAVRTPSREARARLAVSVGCLGCETGFADHSETASNICRYLQSAKRWKKGFSALEERDGDVATKKIGFRTESLSPLTRSAMVASSKGLQ